MKRKFFFVWECVADALHFAVDLEEQLFAFRWDWPEAEDVYQQPRGEWDPGHRFGDICG